MLKVDTAYIELERNVFQIRPLALVWLISHGHDILKNNLVYMFMNVL